MNFSNQLIILILLSSVRPSRSGQTGKSGGVNETEIEQKINTTLERIYAATDNMNSNWHSFDKLMTDFRLVRDSLMCNNNTKLLTEKFAKVKEKMKNVCFIFQQIGNIVNLHSYSSLDSFLFRQGSPGRRRRKALKNCRVGCITAT